MKLMVAATCAAVIGIALSGSAAAQTAPGLDETLSYISDQIAQQGESELTINNVDPATGQTWANHSTQLGSNFSTDPAHCQINFHWRTSDNGSVSFDGDGGVPFRQLDHVRVDTLDAYFARVNAGGGHSGWNTHATPAMTVVTSVRSDGVEHIFYFQDADVANHVADAMRHAMELCGANR